MSDRPKEQTLQSLAAKVDPIYRYESNGVPNVGLRFSPHHDPWCVTSRGEPEGHLISKEWKHLLENGMASTAKATYHFVRENVLGQRS